LLTAFSSPFGSFSERYCQLRNFLPILKEARNFSVLKQVFQCGVHEAPSYVGIASLIRKRDLKAVLTIAG